MLFMDSVIGKIDAGRHRTTGKHRNGGKEMKTKILQKNNKIIAVCLVLFALAYLFAARNMNFGSWSSPKTGFMPKVSGVGMLIFSAINLVGDWRKPDEIPEELREVNWVKAFLYIGACAVYVILLSAGVGYLIATPVCLLAMIKFTGIKGWKIPIVTTVLVTAFFYGVFHVVMGVYLPRIDVLNLNI